jgi:putative flippase GtrA/glycosyltransferase involved in cell wall biosynthesis
MSFYNTFKNYLRSLHPGWYRRLDSKKVFIKYVISGGTAAFVDLALLYILTDVFRIWYLYSATLAFLAAFFVSFYLQKFWTFRDNCRKKIRRQMVLYFAVGAGNLGINAAGMYLLVDRFNVMYIWAQVLIGALIAVSSFLIYKFVIFKKHKNEPVTQESKLKILLATGIYPPDIGGPAKYAKNLMNEFLKRGHEVKVLSYRFEKRLPIGIRHCFYFLKVILNIYKVDLIIALDMLSTGFPAILAGKIFNRKTILRIGGDFLWETYIERTGNLITLKDFYSQKPNLSFKYKIIRFLQKFTLKNASALAFNSKWQRDLFKQIYNLDKSKIFVIENYYGNNKKIVGAKSKRKNFLFAGRRIKFKNLELLKEIFKELEKEGRRVKLEIISGLLQEELQRKIEDSYALITVSISDFAPNFIIEGLSAGKPFILTKECGLTERLNELGIFVNPFNKDEIKQAILSLIDERNYDKYRERIVNFNFIHSWSQVADEFLAIYKLL